MTTAYLDLAAASRGRPALGEVSSDETLIQRIAAGDRLAMRTLFARHRVAVYRWLLRLVNDEALAEDLLSDVFLDVWRQAASFEARASVSTWLLAIARYKALSSCRRRIDAALDDQIASTVADPADGPDLVLEKKSTIDLMRACLAELSPEHREVMDLVYYHEKSVREVAQIIGIPEPTVKTRMFYARKKLAELVAARTATER
jgi:RNA polymerase sigma-70 factor, ECF subfamily